MYNIALNTNTIPHLWKRATFIPISKANKHHNIGTNYRLTLLTITKHNRKILIICHQQGFKHKDSTHTARHLPPNHKTVQQSKASTPPQRIVTLALDMSKAFDTINIHKLTLTNTLNIIITFIANCIHGLQACTQYNGTFLNLNEITLEYHKVEFCLQHYSTYTSLIFYSSQKKYKLRHMLMTYQSLHLTASTVGPTTYSTISSKNL